MIIQNTTQASLSPNVVANTSNTQAVPAVAVDSPKITSQQPSSVELKNAVDVINQVLRQSNNSLEFSIDPDTKTPIVRMMDTKTGELIRQYPSEETLAISRSIDQFQHQQGLLLKGQA